jgi:hypothetical protein
VPLASMGQDSVSAPHYSGLEAAQPAERFQPAQPEVLRAAVGQLPEEVHSQPTALQPVESRRAEPQELWVESPPPKVDGTWRPPRPASRFSVLAKQV